LIAKFDSKEVHAVQKKWMDGEWRSNWRATERLGHYVLVADVQGRSRIVQVAGIALACSNSVLITCTMSNW